MGKGSIVELRSPSNSRTAEKVLQLVAMYADKIMRIADVHMFQYTTGGARGGGASPPRAQ